MALKDVSAGLGDLSASLNTVTTKVGALETAYQSLEKVFDIGGIRDIEKNYRTLTQTLSASNKEVELIKKSVEELSKITAYYSKQELSGMISKLREGTSAVSLFTKEHDKLIEKFTGAYRQGAQEYLTTLSKLSDAMPLFSTRVKQSALDLDSLYQAFKVSGKEGVSAYIKNIESASQATDKSAQNINDKLSKISKTLKNFSTTVGQGLSSSFSQNPIATVGGLGAVGGMLQGAGGLASIGGNMLSSVGLGGVNKALSSYDMGATANYNPNYGSFRNFLNSGSRNVGGSYLSRAGGVAAGGGAFLLGQSLQDGQDPSSLQATGGRALSIGGAGFAGFQVAGIPGAAVAATAASAHSIYKFFDDTTGPSWHDRRVAGDPGTPEYKAKMREAQEQRNEGMYFQSFEDTAQKKIGSFKGDRYSSAAYLNESSAYGDTATKIGDEINRLKDKVTDGTANQSEQQRFERLSAMYGGYRSQAENRGNLAVGIAGSALEGVSSRQQIAISTGYGDVNQGGGISATQDVIKTLQSQLALTPQSDIAKRQQIQTQIAQAQSGGMYSASTVNNQSTLTGAGLSLQGLSARAGQQNFGSSYDELNKTTEKQKEQYELIKKTELSNAAIAISLGQTRTAQEALNRAAESEVQIKGLSNQEYQRSLSLRLQDLSVTQKARGYNTEGTGAVSSLSSLQENLKVAMSIADPKNLNATTAEKEQANRDIRDYQNQIKGQNVAIALKGTQISNQYQAGALSALGPGGQYTEETLNQNQAAELKIRLAQELDPLQKADIENQLRIIDLKQKLISSYGKEAQNLQFQSDMISKRITLYQSLGLPLQAAKEMGEQVKVGVENIANLRKEYQVKEAAGANKGELQDVQKRILDAQVSVAQSLNFQRRSLAEQFTDQAINLGTGSYLNPMSPSGYAMFGSGYFTGKSQGGKSPGTYQNQLQTVLGPGVDERSPWEQAITSVIGNLNDTLSKGVSISGSINIDSGVMDAKLDTKGQ